MSILLFALTKVFYVLTLGNFFIVVSSFRWVVLYC